MIITKEELANWPKEKLVDHLFMLLKEDAKRRQKVRDWGKKWREKQKAELAEFRAYKANQALRSE